MISPSATIGIDVGGTTVKAALVDSDNQILHRWIASTIRSSVRTSLIEAVNELSAFAHRSHIEIDGCGVGVPEYVKNGAVTSTEVIAWDRSYLDAIRSRLSEFGWPETPVNVEADVRCGAAAEHAFLSDTRGQRSMFYVSWGTGVSSALVLPNGTVWEGHRGEALAIGEFRITLPDQRTTHLETIASGDGIASTYLKRTGESLTAEAIANLARAGDRAAIDTMVNAGRLLAEALHGAVSVLDPEVVVIGGGLGTAETAAGASLRSTYAALGRKPDRAPLVSAALGPDSGTIGAALIARRATH